MKIVFLLAVLLITTWSTKAQSNPAGLTGGEVKPILFMEGIVSDGFANRDITISRSGNEIFYTLQQRQGLVSCIMYMKRTGKTWSAPIVAPFSGRYADLEATFSPDEKRIYFSSNRPMKDGEKAKDYDVWYVERKGTSWSEPVNVGSPVNSNKDEFYPSVARSGNLYFTRTVSDAAKEDIVCSRWENGRYLEPVSLPPTVNTAGFEFNAFVNADETILVFTATRRPDDIGGGDLYISVNKNGQWSEAKNLGPIINSKFIDYCPFISADGKFLYFTSSRCDITLPIKNKKVPNILKNAGNGFDDIYVVAMPEIE